MPGIVGVVFQEPGPIITEMIDRMTKPLIRASTHRVQTSIGAVAGFGGVSLGDDIYLAAENGVVALVAGEIHDADWLRARLLTAGDRDAKKYGLANLFLSAYQHFGITAICGLNGLYVAAFWNERTRQLTIVNDRYGIRKLYYWENSGSFWFASEYKCLSLNADFPHQINEAALSDLLLLGFPLEERTLFEAIKILPSATILNYQDGKLQLDQYWNYQFDSSGSTDARALASHIDGLGELTREAVRRRLIDHSCILLTGGLDSRTIAGFSKQINPTGDVIASTLGPPNSIDVRIARSVANKLGIQHYNVAIPTDYLNRFAERSVWLTEGNLSVYASWILAQESLFNSRPYDSVLTGIGGEVISGRLAAFEKLETDIDKALHIYIRTSRQIQVKELLRPEVYQRIQNVSLDTIRSTILSAPTEDPLNKLDYMSFQQDFRRHASSIDVLGDFSKVFDPLIDNDLVDYALMIPPRLRARAYTYKKMIARFLPQVLMDDEIHEKQTLIVSPYQLIDHPYLKWMEKIQKGVQKKFRRFGNIHGDIDGSIIKPNLLMRTVSRNFIRMYLWDGEYISDYFDVNKVRQLIEDHFEARRNAYWMISALLTFAIWRHLFGSSDAINVHIEDNNQLHTNPIQ
ncbi:MAG TPA: asparagine synthase-related protein [Anaerolineaceae bacterium]|nr:asparagine synthase-related protein [Anaerolineaceae bacterium]